MNRGKHIQVPTNLLVIGVLDCLAAMVAKFGMPTKKLTGGILQPSTTKHGKTPPFIRLRLTSAQRTETNALFDEIQPVAIEKRADGSYRVDMGVNFAGWTQINVNGNPGDTIRFLFSEREQDDMTFGLNNAYVLGKSGKGTFKNRFNYSSGRWITKRTKIGSTKRGYWLGGSHHLCRCHHLNVLIRCVLIYNTVNWTFENLSLGGYIVDCPQRERFGYGGDAHATSETGMLNYNLGAFYNKWLKDWRDVQGVEPMVGNMNDPNWARKHEGSGRKLGGGILPQTAPTYHGGGGPAWGGIVVTLPWFMYQYQGDVRVLEENFEMIKGWLAFLDSCGKQHAQKIRRSVGLWVTGCGPEQLHRE